LAVNGYAWGYSPPWQHGRHGERIHAHPRFEREDDVFVALCPQFDIAGQGAPPFEEARTLTASYVEGERAWRPAAGVDARPTLRMK
jgi:hypothetical protein